MMIYSFQNLIIFSLTFLAQGRERIQKYEWNVYRITIFINNGNDETCNKIFKISLIYQRKTWRFVITETGPTSSIWKIFFRVCHKLINSKLKTLEWEFVNEKEQLRNVHRWCFYTDASKQKIAKWDFLLIIAASSLV
jgi:hypothetical protein